MRSFDRLGRSRCANCRGTYEMNVTNQATESLPCPFIVGTGRSGTTLLRLMLDAHSHMAIPGETSFLADILSHGKGLKPLSAFLSGPFGQKADNYITYASAH